MSAVALVLALVFLLRYTWLTAVVVMVVTALLTVNLTPLPLFAGCLLALLLCSLRPLRVRTAHWAVWRNLDEYYRFRARTRPRGVHVHIHTLHRFWSSRRR
jgi:hypothetical protein